MVLGFSEGGIIEMHGDPRTRMHFSFYSLFVNAKLMNSIFTFSRESNMYYDDCPRYPLCISRLLISEGDERAISIINALGDLNNMYRP